MAVWLAILCLIIAAAVMMVSPDGGAVGGVSNEVIACIAVGLSAIIFLGGTIAKARRGVIVQIVRHTATWSAMFVALVGIYVYRAEMVFIADKVLGAFPQRTPQIHVAKSFNPNPAPARIKRDWSGHFIAPASIGGATVNMIVDTGASTIVLRHEDAKRLGIDMKALKYTVPVHTANGSSFAARVRLSEVFVGEVGVGNVDAMVVKPGSLQQSLLGMSFLSRLRSYEFSGDHLELRG